MIKLDHGQASDPHAGHKTSDTHASHDRHAGHSVAMFRDKFWLSFVLTIPVVFWSTDVQHWLGYRAPTFPGSELIPPIVGTVVFVYGGLVFIRGAWGELADHKPGMMTLISLGIIAAFGTSLAATFGLFELDVWWELTSLITIMLLGHWLEMRAVSQARGALNALAALLPDTAERVIGADTESVPLSELRVGDIVLVRPGARVPADGTVVEGAADVDESMITGESKTVPKGVGAKVVAGTVASRGSLRVRITAIGGQTALAGIMRLVATAQASGSRAQAFADRAAAILFYVAVASGAITFTYWSISGDKEHAMIRTAVRAAKGGRRHLAHSGRGSRYSRGRKPHYSAIAGETPRKQLGQSKCPLGHGPDSGFRCGQVRLDYRSFFPSSFRDSSISESTKSAFAA